MNIIAYGSLLNKASLEKTLAREVTYEIIKLSKYERVFNAPFGEYAYLNLQKKSGARFRAASFWIEKEELTKFDDREAGSDLVELQKGYYAFVWPQEYCRDLPVLQSYLDVCSKGNTVLGLDMWECTVRPKLIMNDRTRPLY